MAILTDQQRWDTLGAYGNPMDPTPTLDALAHEAIFVAEADSEPIERLDRAFTPQPIYGPVRAALTTCEHPIRRWRIERP